MAVVAQKLNHLRHTMNPITAILVDDEESARDVLEHLLLRFCPDIKLLAKCQNIPEAVDTIHKVQPQLVFLDIEMPNYAGYEIVKFFPEINFDIIFITAYNQYAIRAFELAATDYLLKPIDIDRLKEAVQKVVLKQTLVHSLQERLGLVKEAIETKVIKSIAVTDKGQQTIIQLADIIAIEALESYCTIHCAQKKYTVSKNLKHFETMFQHMPQFFRTHKSWLIHKEHMIHYSKSLLVIKMADRIEAKLSKYKKAEFEQFLLQ